MSEQDTFWWKAYANQWLSPIERTKDDLRLSIECLRKKHPEWERNNDARWAWATGIKKTLQNTQLSLVFIKFHMTEPEWWRGVDVQALTLSDIPEHVKEFEVGVRVALVQITFSVLEDTLRSITRALYPTEPKQATQNFHNIYQHLLTRTGLTDYGALFDCYSVFRNTVHTNGTFYPQSGGDRQFVIDGRTFMFRVGKRVQAVDLETLLWFLSRMNKALLTIVQSPLISRLPVVTRLAE